MNATFEAPLWRWEARAEDWYFVTVPAEIGGDIAELPRTRRGFGAVKVAATLGGTRWKTSIFPQREIPDVGVEYALPIKRSVREAEGIVQNARCTITIEVVDA